MTRISGTYRRRRRPTPAGAVVTAFALAGALVAAGPGPTGAQQQQPQGTAPSSTTGAGQSGVGDTGQGNSLPMPANPAGQTTRAPMQNQSNPGSTAAGAADSSPTSGTTGAKQLPPEPGQSAGQQGTGRSVDLGAGRSGQQQMPQPQAGGGQAAGQAGGQGAAAAPSVELQSTANPAQQPVTRQSLEPQQRVGDGPSGLEKGEPGGETKVTPGGGGGSEGGPNAGGIPVAPQGSGTR